MLLGNDETNASPAGDNKIVVDNAETTGPTKTVFGWNAKKLQTPEAIREKFKLYLFIVTLAIIVISGSPDISEATKTHILTYTAILTLILNKLEDYFGTTTTNP